MGTRGVPADWAALVEQQHGLFSRSQLRRYGVPRGFVRNQLRAARWAERSGNVLSATTGPLAWDQRVWLGVLHAGGDSLVGGLTAAQVQGMRGWDRDEVTVLVDDELSFDPVPGVRFFRTRRPLAPMRAPGHLPVCRLEPAVLLFAGYTAVARTGQGAVAAAVQQRLTTPDRVGWWLTRMRPLRRSRMLGALLGDLAGGAQSLAEADVGRACRTYGVVRPQRQRPRSDRGGRRRWTDCEWDLPDGRVLVLEVDGAFHLDVRQYDADMRRQRRLTSATRTVVRCSAFEIRHEPGSVMEDLIALGAPRSCAPVAAPATTSAHDRAQPPARPYSRSPASPRPGTM